MVSAWLARCGLCGEPCEPWSMLQNRFNSEYLLTSMGRSIGFASPHYFAMEKGSPSPYINRFLSADTIVPGYANPQSLNRFSYVHNNPLRYIDPSGHMPDDGCSLGCSYTTITSDYCDTHPGDCGGGGTGGESENGRRPDEGGDHGVINDILETIIQDDLQVLVDNDCSTQNGAVIDWTNSICVDALSSLSQDIATLTSSVSASWTAILTILGCGAEGVGCVAGYGVGFVDHLMFFNPLESTSSTFSFGLTMYSDLLTHDTYFNSWTDWGVGEDTKTGFVTWTTGSLTVEPFFDAGIDIYASGYNHGYFCGISTVAACIESTMRGFP